MKLKIALICAIVAFVLSLAFLGWAFFFVFNTKSPDSPIFPKPTYTPAPTSHSPILADAQPTKFIVFDLKMKPIANAIVEAFITGAHGEKPAATGTSDINGHLTLNLPHSKPIASVKTRATGYLQNIISQVPLDNGAIEIYLDPEVQQPAEDDKTTTPDNDTSVSKAQPSGIKGLIYYIADNGERTSLDGTVQLAWYEARTAPQTGQRQWHIASKAQTIESFTDQEVDLPEIATNNPLLLVGEWNGFIAESEVITEGKTPAHPIVLTFRKPIEFTINATASKQTEIPNLIVKMARQRCPRDFNYNSVFQGINSLGTQVKLDIPYGDYKLEAGAPGYTTVSLTVKVDANSPNAAQVRLRRQPPGIDISVSEDAMPLANAPMVLTSRYNADIKSQFATSSPEGKFHFENLAPETTYTITATHPKNSMRQKSANIFYATAESSLSAEIAFGHTIRIGGDVKQKDGSPTAATLLRFIPRGSIEPAAECKIQSNGIWAVELESGEYVVQHDGPETDSEIIEIKPMQEQGKHYNLVFGK